MIIYIKKWLDAIFYHPTYQSRLDAYISARNPKDIYDVERLCKEFDTKLSQGVI